MGIIETEYINIPAWLKVSLLHCLVKTLCRCIVYAEYCLNTGIPVKKLSRFLNAEFGHVRPLILILRKRYLILRQTIHEYPLSECSIYIVVTSAEHTDIRTALGIY